MSYVTHCLYAAIGSPVAILTMDMQYFDGTFMGHFPGPKDLVALLVSNEGHLFRGDECQWGIWEKTFDNKVNTVHPIFGLQSGIQIGGVSEQEVDELVDTHFDILMELERFRIEGSRIFAERFQPGMPVRNFADKYPPTTIH